MGYNNPPIKWSELERRLSDRSRPGSHGGRPVTADGGDSPAWSQHRGPYVPAKVQRGEAEVAYAELHVHSNYSFLDGASQPEELIETAVRQGLHALALTDHDGFYGAARFAEAAAAYSLPTVFGAELSLGLTHPQNGVADPEGSHLLVLAEGQEGYHQLAGAITEAQLAGEEKGRPVYHLEELAKDDPEWVILTGCRKGLVRQALERGGQAEGPAAAGRELDRLTQLFGKDRVVVELIDHHLPTDTIRNRILAELAADRGLPVVATNNVHYAAPAQYKLASALAAVRARRDLDAMDGWLPPSGMAFLRTGAEMAYRFRRYDGAVARSVTLADQLAFDLARAKPKLPLRDVPKGETPMSWLRHVTFEGAARRYGTREQRPDAYDRLARELAVIEEKGFPGYFLIVHDIVSFAHREGILCQGRGSAANSAVCYALGITAVDSILYDLPFERFLASTRAEEPDIDVDFDSDRREEVIQYVYGKYGRRNAAQVANVISYRPKSAVRDVAKALGYSVGQQDAWSKQVDGWSPEITSTEHDIPPRVVAMATQLLKFPRHLGIHSGGMVLTERPVGQVVPIEHARKENRTVLQWDKDDCAWMGLVKFDLLGLGMLAALQYCLDMVRDRLGESWLLHNIPKEEAGVYDQLCRADSVGVFQVESRAQMATLPRLRPRKFYDLVTEIALIRPGPIQGGAVHPYIRRRTGEEPVTYLHPKLKPVLERTMGVPLFQEQLMQMAMAVGEIDGDEADLLRRAMGSKRGVEKISSLQDKLYAGMARNGIEGELADEIYAKIEAFANFGFAESHSISFALLVYSSTWLRLHYPAAFLAALLRAQPMGFYSPQSLVADARRHGVEVRRPDLQRSAVDAELELLVDGQERQGPTGSPSCLLDPQPPVGPFDPKAPFDSTLHRRDGVFAVRLGLSEVRTVGEKGAKLIVEERERGGPYRDMADLVRRTGITAGQVEALATAGAFDCFGLDRRQALWEAGRAAEERPDRLAGVSVAGPPPTLPGMSDIETDMADLWSTSITTTSHPIERVRADLRAAGILSAAQLREVPDGARVRVAGVVTHRQRPATASGVTFMNLEDETGMANIVITKGCWRRHAATARNATALIVRGRVERAGEVTNLSADSLTRLPLATKTPSRDFR
ncbi:error-prone DNA polymerase [Kribbella sandramycini]|uniref:Error-prone DNA polymerase n=1 Tax=Kribbella sandramycini TaxID=60450 RepID=A0A7Y4KX36_9ACTN|nr:error-prone DNA polymerase [Kribbella sandramycini]MBB6569966.1 error-prone DNA polymerase [Kribbella sandramycini]NOL40210.1 error-prone DNA polymerase [Kribbella sandramycini]